MSDPAVSAAAAGTITIGGDLTVNRLGFGAMRITGRGIWGDHPIATRRRRCCAARSSSASTSSTPPTPTAGGQRELIAEALHPYPDELVIATKGGLERPGPGGGRPTGGPSTSRGLRGQPAPAAARADPAVPVPPARPAGALEESIGALVELKDEGKIRHIGLSNVDRGAAARGPGADADRVGAEPLQRRPTAARSARRPVRAGADRVPPVGADPGPRRRAGRSRDRRAARATPRRWCWRGCWPARRRCCRSRARGRWRTSRRTWRPPRSVSATTSSRRSASGRSGGNRWLRTSVNEAAVAHARRLIDARQYVLDSDWGEVQPEAEDENAYLESHSWEEYAEWHLGLTEGANRRDQGAVRLRLRRLPPRPPHRADRLRVPRRRVASQGGRARRPRPAAAPRQHVGVLNVHAQLWRYQPHRLAEFVTGLPKSRAARPPRGHPRAGAEAASSPNATASTSASEPSRRSRRPTSSTR